MNSRAQQHLHHFAVVLEFIVAGVLCLNVLFYTFQLLGSTFHIEGFTIYDEFKDILDMAFTLVIGVEILRMMCEHSTEVVFEVLTFAIARQIVIDHSNAIDNVYGVVALAILFATRKYLLPVVRDKMDKKDASPEDPKDAGTPV
ncbi:MAG: hypothetical protein LIO51_01765 [Clostridiales bacterium]|nr:hypothetical protein [Clostridiales bacterium]